MGPVTDLKISSEGFHLAVHVSLPGPGAPRPPVVVLCHGYPSGPGGAEAAVSSFPELGDRIAREMGWVAFVPCLRGIGESSGDFSIANWLGDLLAVVDHVSREHPNSGIWLAGFGTGGALAVCAGARDERVRGVASLAAPADFDDWAGSPRRLLEHARDLGIVHRAASVSMDAWARDLKSVRAVTSASELVPRPLLVIHGSDDDTVPPFDARVIADAHGSAELRVIQGGGHALRHDPRAVAMLLGWLDRQHHVS